jgi:hypothetical protein
MPPKNLEALGPQLHRSEWRTRCENAVLHFEANRVSTLKTERTLRKAGTMQSDYRFIITDIACEIITGDVCGRSCASIRLAFMRTDAHTDTSDTDLVIRDPSDRRVDGSVHHMFVYWCEIRQHARQNTVAARPTLFRSILHLPSTDPVLGL